MLHKLLPQARKPTSSDLQVACKSATKTCMPCPHGDHPLQGLVLLLQVACESATKTGMVMIFGEITTKAKVDYEKVRWRRHCLQGPCWSALPSWELRRG